MIHQINLENIYSTTLHIKNTSTKLKTLQTPINYDKKGLLRSYKNNIQIENELLHILNFLDNNVSDIKKEIDQFKGEVCLIGLKNKSSQITCLIDK